MSNSLIQPLEGRLLLSVAWDPNTTVLGDASISLRKGILIVHGGAGNDRIRFSTSVDFRAPAVEFPYGGKINGKLVVHINRNTASFSFDDIRQIRIEGGGGDDNIEVLPVTPPPTCPSGGVWVYGGIFMPFGWQDKPTVILGGDGNDTIVGGNLNDSIFGGSGDDVISGNGGNDRLMGNSGNDVILGNEGNDYIDGGSGDDTLWGTSDHFKLQYDDADTLVGRDGADQLHGESGDDLLVGGNNNDRLWGDDGADQASGGAGRDAGNQIEKSRDNIERTLANIFSGTSCV